MAQFNVVRSSPCDSVERRARQVKEYDRCSLGWNRLWMVSQGRDTGADRIGLVEPDAVAERVDDLDTLGVVEGRVDAGP